MKIKGKAILQHIVDSSKYCKKVDQIIVATSTLKADDEIEKLCSKIKIKCSKFILLTIFGGVENVVKI